MLCTLNFLAFSINPKKHSKNAISNAKRTIEDNMLIHISNYRILKNTTISSSEIFYVNCDYMDWKIIAFEVNKKVFWSLVRQGQQTLTPYCVRFLHNHSWRFLTIIRKTLLGTCILNLRCIEDSEHF